MTIASRETRARLGTMLVVAMGVQGCGGPRSKHEHIAQPDAPSSTRSPFGPPRSGRPPSPDLAVVVTSEGVVGLDPVTGQRSLVLTTQADVSWCRIDPRGSVLWLQHGEDGTLSVVDLESNTPPITVLERAPWTVVIAYEGDLDRPESFEFEDGVVVHVEARPRAEAILGCDGNLAFSCFDDIDDIEAEYDARLAGLRTMVEAKPLPNPDVLIAMAKRNEGYRPPIAPMRGPAPARVLTVPPEPCTDSEVCGEALRLPGTPYWLVVVGNRSNDFYYEDHQLYDPETAEFFDPRDPTARSRQPLDVDHEFEPAWVSPSGALALGSNALVKLEGGGTLASGFTGVCGFWGGGWEAPSLP